MPNVTRNSVKSSAGAGASKTSEPVSASCASQKASPPYEDTEESEPAWGIPGELAKELARLSALIVEKSDVHDKKLEEIRISTSATESKLADIVNRIERAHRIGAPPKRYEGDQPPRARPLIARFLRFQDRNRVAEAARCLGDIVWEGHRIMIFPDYSRLLSEKRNKFNECKKLLHNKRIGFSLIYPAVLVVKAPQGSRRFEDHKKAMTFIRSMV
ncbi:uncharacterized protein LOC120730442 [Simochromis diagramma]|uniref:uncharacterized protein LOC120730442 n=1 Tax=Simochromis diagramma TaxID=43689 RepID=UPI001A7EBD2C|nr:uncharacterized protein LOC120730442 [Simochromis diagramma]